MSAGKHSAKKTFQSWSKFGNERPDTRLKRWSATWLKRCKKQESVMFRVVLDTNIIVSGLISKRGAPADILKAWRNREFVFLLSPEIFSEIERVLAYPKIANKYGLTPSKQKQVVAVLKKYAVLVEPANLKVPVCSDPDDDKFLTCAVAGQADFVVSGDSDLLELKTHCDIEIATGGRFLVALEENIRRAT